VDGFSGDHSAKADNESYTRLETTGPDVYNMYMYRTQYRS